MFGYLGPNGAGKTTTIRILADVEAVADTVAILRRGELVMTKSIDELRQRALRHLELTFAGAILGRRSLAIGIAAAAANGAYVLYATGLMLESVEPWAPLSPFHQALTGGPLGAGLTTGYLWLAAGAAALTLIAAPALDGRDIAAHA